MSTEFIAGDGVTSEKSYDNSQRIDALVARVAALEGGSYQAVFKTADTSRASTTTLSNDPDLQFTVLSSAVYVVQFHLITSGANSASAGFKWDWQTPGSSPMPYEVHYTNVGGALVDQENVVPAAVALVAATNGVGINNPVTGTGLLTCTSGGNFAVQWAQGTSNATNSWLRAGSFLVARRVA